MEQTSILITGKFADEDMKAIMAVLREIERRHPDDLYTAMIIESPSPVHPGHAVVAPERSLPAGAHVPHAIEAPACRAAEVARRPNTPASVLENQVRGRQ
jgi:hypothetical protein